MTGVIDNSVSDDDVLQAFIIEDNAEMGYQILSRKSSKPYSTFLEIVADVINSPLEGAKP